MGYLHLISGMVAISHHQARCGQHFVSITAEQKNKWQELIEKLSKCSDLFATVYDPST